MVKKEWEDQIGPRLAMERPNLKDIKDIIVGPNWSRAVFQGIFLAGRLISGKRPLWKK